MASEPIFVDAPVWAWGKVVDACMGEMTYNQTYGYQERHMLVEFDSGRIEQFDTEGYASPKDLIGVHARDVRRHIWNADDKGIQRRTYRRPPHCTCNVCRSLGR